MSYLIDHLSMVWERAGGRCLSLASALKTRERVGSEQQPNGPISSVPTRPPIQNVTQLFLSLPHNIIFGIN